MRERTFPAEGADFINFDVDNGGLGALHAAVVGDHLEDVIVRLLVVERPGVLDITIGIDHEGSVELVSADDLVLADFVELAAAVMVDRLHLDDWIDNATLVHCHRVRVLAEDGRIFIQVLHDYVHSSAEEWEGKR